MEKIKDVEK